jgi:hypothetical protein
MVNSSTTADCSKPSFVNSSQLLGAARYCPRQLCSNYSKCPEFLTASSVGKSGDILLDTESINTKIAASSTGEKIESLDIGILIIHSRTNHAYQP